MSEEKEWTCLKASEELLGASLTLKAMRKENVAMDQGRVLLGELLKEGN